MQQTETYVKCTVAQMIIIFISTLGNGIVERAV